MAPGAPDGGSASGRPSPGRRLRVSVEPGAGLELLTPPPAEVELYHARSRTVTMRLRATERLGGDRVLFRVAPPEGEQGREVTRSAALSVRPAIPRAAAVSFGRMDAFRLFGRRGVEGLAQTAPGILGIFRHGLGSAAAVVRGFRAI